jgi:hypothetical protein
LKGAAKKGHAMNINTSPKETNDSNPTATKATKLVTADVIITDNLIAQLRKDIAKIGTESTEGISKRQAVILLLKEITDARARKVSFKGIEAAFKARGILISAATIGTYWRQAMADIEATKPKPIKPVPEVIPTPEVNIAVIEQTPDNVAAPKPTLLFRNITDNEFEDNAALLRRMGNETSNTELDKSE